MTCYFLKKVVFSFAKKYMAKNTSFLWLKEAKQKLLFKNCKYSFRNKKLRAKSAFLLEVSPLLGLLT